MRGNSRRASSTGAIPSLTRSLVGIFSIGFAFLVGIVVSLLTPEKTAADMFEQEKLRTYAGIGAVAAVPRRRRAGTLTERARPLAAAGQSAVKLFRAGVHRGRDFASIVSDLNDTYNVIEAWCMVTAAAFATVMIVAAFGLRF